MVRTTAAVMLADIHAKDRAKEKLNRHRWAVMTLARQRAIKEIKQEFRAQGVRLHEVPNKVINILADAWLDAHRAQLVAEAETTINTWPGFARWRCPDTVSVKVPETEHSQATAAAIKGQISND